MGAALTTSGRLRLLDTAFDQGIRHFDTAPLYGMGQAEELLGRFLRRRRGEITLTTKFGLVPPAIPAPLRPLVPVARLVHRQLGGRWATALRAIARGRRTVQPTAAGPPSPGRPSPPSVAPAVTPYDPAALRASLESSLRKLDTDHIDFFLLHECQPGQLSHAVVDLLEALVAEGKIGRWGLGSGRGASRAILEGWPHFNGVAQIPDHLLRPDTAWFSNQAAPPLFTHGVLQAPLRDPTVQPTLTALLARWAERTGQDPTRSGLLGELLLLGGLLNNPSGCVLFSTSRPERIRTLGQVVGQLPRLGPALEELLEELLAELTLDGGGATPCL